jgi:hypothetical protein
MKLTDRERDFLQRIWNGTRLRLADREEDKVRQRMRKAGFARVVVSPRRWTITDAGRAALREEKGE